MKAIRIHFFGGPEVMRLEDVPVPQPSQGEVLIKVRAASVNPVDYKTRSGTFRGGAKTPMTLGRDVSGTIERLGPGVDGFHVGDEIYAMLGAHSGGYAEFAVAKEEEIAAKPAKLDHINAAAVPLAAITAWQGLFDHGKLASGQRVLIHGAAGGVGLFAVQFAKAKGAHVIATAGRDDLDLLKKLGADEVIDYRAERFEDKVRDVDLVLDLVAGDTQSRSWNVLKPGGRIISTLQSPSQEEAARHHAEGKVFMAEPRHEQLAEISRMIDAGKVRVILDQTMPLAEARRAHEHMENDHIRGKVVLTVT